MSQPTEARIVITRGKRVDLMASLDIYEPRNGRLHQWNLVAGPSESDIAFKVRQLRSQLERAGHRVSVVER